MGQLSSVVQQHARLGRGVDSSTFPNPQPILDQPQIDVMCVEIFILKRGGCSVRTHLLCVASVKHRLAPAVVLQQYYRRQTDILLERTKGGIRTVG